MTYLLTTSNPVGAEIRRVLRELLTEASERAGVAARLDVHVDVHEVRKSLKKARAALKLVRVRVPDYLDHKVRYRDLGRRLSSLRDAAAVVETLGLLGPELAEVTSPELVAGQQRLLLDRRDAIAQAAGLELRAVAPLLAAAAADVDQIRFDTTGDPLRAGLEREYRRGRTLAGALHVGDDAVRFHAWRKRAKEHRYHIELLFGEGPESAPFGALTDLLGTAQDVSVLLEFIDEQGADALHSALTDLRARLQAQALELAAELYAPSSADMSAALLGRPIASTSTSR